MRHFKVYIGLFTAFVAFMSVTRFLDAYSAQYVKCAQKWESSVELASDQPYLSDKLLEILDENALTVQGETCPKLREDHKALIKTRLETQTGPVLRSSQSAS